MREFWTLNIIVGVLSSLLASAIVYLVVEDGSAAITVIVVILGLISAALAVAQYRSVQLLKRLGIDRWEARALTGTSTEACISLAKRHLRFHGIAASKWLKHTDSLKKMLRRLADAGGDAEFLLLDPKSPACAHFERRRQLREGSLATLIESNVRDLQALRAEGLPIKVAFYASAPRFRLVLIDEELMIVGMYSFNSDDGNSPQLLLRPGNDDWSFFYAFRALLTNEARSARPDS